MISRWISLAPAITVEMAVSQGRRLSG